MSTQHTPGPWRWEFNAKHRSVHLVGGKPQFDLTIMDFCRWGMGGATMLLRDTAHDGMNIMHKLHERPDWIAPQPGREHHKSWHQLVTHPDARLIEAAPDLLEALKEMVEIAELTIGWLPTPPNANGPLIQARAAIAKAEGGTA
jgi:hypothetical protein